jgi:signal peptidase II
MSWVMESADSMRDLNMLKWLWLSLLALVLDQVSKLIIAGSMQLYQSIPITSFFKITYVRNTGAAFSFLSEAGGWQRWFFAGLALVISAVIAVWLARLKKHETFLAIALS